jgi:hypothetical protein
MIDQATKVMNSVHKRLHASQAEELQMLARLFKENPQSFWQKNRRPARQWDEQTFLQALEDCNLVPQADPNTASHGQRVMKIMGLKQLQQQNPSMYDPIAIDTAAMQAMGWSNPNQFLAPPQAQSAPPPEMQQIQSKIAAEQKDSQARMMMAQAKSAEVQAKIQQGAYAPKHDAGLMPKDHGKEEISPIDMMDAKAKLIAAQTKARELGIRQADVSAEDKNRTLDRQSRERIELLKLAKDLTMHPETAPAIEAMARPTEQELKKD